MKPTKALLVSAAWILGTMGVQAADFVQNGNYLTVQLKQHQNYGPSQIRLQVVNDRIIRVQATAEQSFRNKQSLIIVPQKGKANYKVEEQGDDLIITTAAMRAVLNEATGQIIFYDLKDQVLLKEVAQGGKTFKPFTVPDREIGVDIAKVPDAQKHGWSWRALFDSPERKDSSLVPTWIRTGRRLYVARTASTLNMPCLKLQKPATRLIRVVSRTCLRALR